MVGHHEADENVEGEEVVQGAKDRYGHRGPMRHHRFRSAKREDRRVSNRYRTMTNSCFILN